MPSYLDSPETGPRPSVETRATIIPDLTHAFAVTFSIAAVISFIGVVAISFLEEVPFKTTAGKAPAERAEE